MARIKLFETFKIDKIQDDMKDIFLEFEDMGMNVRVQSPYQGFAWVIIKQPRIVELNSLNLDYSATKDEFFMKDDDGKYILDINSLIDITKPVFESTLQMFMEYMKEYKLIKISYKEPFSTSKVNDISGMLFIEELDQYEILEETIKGKRLENLQIYFKVK